MGKPIVSESFTELQLVTIAIELVHKVLALSDCAPELESNVHMIKAVKLAHLWNEAFFNVMSSKKGGN